MIRFGIGIILAILAASANHDVSLAVVAALGISSVAFMMWGLPRVLGASGWTE